MRAPPSGTSTAPDGEMEPPSPAAAVTVCVSSTASRSNTASTARSDTTFCTESTVPDSRPIASAPSTVSDFRTQPSSASTLNSAEPPRGT